MLKILKHAAGIALHTQITVENRRLTILYNSLTLTKEIFFRHFLIKQQWHNTTGRQFGVFLKLRHSSIETRKIVMFEKSCHQVVYLFSYQKRMVFKIPKDGLKNAEECRVCLGFDTENLTRFKSFLRVGVQVHIL